MAVAEDAKSATEQNKKGCQESTSEHVYKLDSFENGEHRLTTGGQLLHERNLSCLGGHDGMSLSATAGLSVRFYG